MKPLLFLVALASASGAGAQSSAGETGLVLTPRIKTALFSEKTLDASNSAGNTDGLTRTLTLSGTVTSPEQKSLAEAITRSAAGCEVRDHLVVRVQASAASPYSLSPAQNIAGVPVKYRRAVQFLQLLARSQGRSQGQTFRERISAFPPGDVARILSFVSFRGVSILDVNESRKPLVLSKARLGRDLTRTGSSAFDSFAYAGYIFAIPFVQYSKLSVHPNQSGVVIEMPSGHRFTWKREGERLQLRKIEYLHLEGD